MNTSKLIREPNINEKELLKKFEEDKIKGKYNRSSSDWLFKKDKEDK